MKNNIYLRTALMALTLFLACNTSIAQIITNDGNIHFNNSTQPSQRLYGNNSAHLAYYSKSSTTSYISIYDKEETLYGRIYGSSNGVNFGLRDGDNHWSYLAVKDNYTAFKINNSEKMRIKSNGYVGIGTNTPSRHLHVRGIIRSSYASNISEYVEINHGGTNAYINAVGDGNLDFRHDNSTKMSVTSDGKVGIGTTTPLNKLQVANAFSFHDGGHEIIGFGCAPGASNTDLNSAGYSSEIRLDPANGLFRFGVSSTKTNNPSTHLSINKNGNVGIGTITPSYKLHVIGSTYTSSSMVSGAANAARYAYGGYGIIHRNDGNNYYILLTNANDPNGGWNTHRPFRINNASGNIYLGDQQLNVINGKVGMGTSSPGYKLQVQGDIYANGGWLRVSGQNGLLFQTYGGGFYMRDGTWIRTHGGKSFYHETGTMRTDGTFQVGPNGSRMIVKTNGTVGIGTTSIPSGYKLAVDGNVIAERVRVRLSQNWPDYVFQEDYNLMTIDELNENIKQNGHLPNIPDAATMTAEGQDLGEMQVKMMEKIEELTLYIIEINERIKTLEQENTELKTNKK